MDDAIEGGNLELVMKIIDSKGLKKFDDYELLRTSLKNHRLEIAKYLLKMGCNVNPKGCSNNISALHYAAKAGDPDIVRQIIERGARINAANSSGETALHYAIKSNSAKKSEIVQLLVQNKADITRKGSGVTPLATAIANGDKEVVECFVELLHLLPREKRGDLPLFFAVGRGDVAMCEVILKKGAYVSDVQSIATEFRGMEVKGSPLYYAVKKGHIEVVKLLINYGADAELHHDLTKVEKNRHSSPVLNAHNNGSKHMFELLLNEWPELGDNECGVILEGFCMGKNGPFTENQKMLALYFAKTIPLKSSKLESLESISSKSESLESMSSTLQILKSLFGLMERSIQDLPLAEFRKTCEKEVALMKTETVTGETKYFDLVSKTVEDIAGLLNQSAVKVLNSGDWKKKFPNYASAIGTKFKRGLLLRKATQFLNNYTPLPVICIDKILKYLPYAGWYSLTEAYVQCEVLQRQASQLEVPNVKAPNVKASNFKASNVEASNVDASNVEVPNVEASNVTVSNVELPN